MMDVGDEEDEKTANTTSEIYSEVMLCFHLVLDKIEGLRTIS